ncbi:MAG: LD-carboxypeptidase [bacterium]
MFKAIYIILTVILFTDANATLINTTIKPTRLHPGDTVGLIAPGFRDADETLIQYAIERLQALGLKVKVGKAVYEQYGYFAGTDKERAADINKMFADPKVKAIIALRGGWGCNRLLNLINYEAIKKNPKIIMGYSDITSLLLAINAKTNLVTFHGPVAHEPWPAFTLGYVKSILFDGKSVTFANPIEDEDDLIHTKNRPVVIRGGKATGKLIGGSLTLLTSMLESKYLPDFDHAILFVEDTGEDIYKIDRMLTQLKTAGILKKISGFVFGKCTDCGCSAGSSTLYGSLTFAQVLKDHIKPLHIPAWYGAMIGHEGRKFTLPEGIRVTIDANMGTITMLEPAVK